jgi:hypothetical protein
LAEGDGYAATHGKDRGACGDLRAANPLVEEEARDDAAMTIERVSLGPSANRRAFFGNPILLRTFRSTGQG